jgi:hypothetical protein
LQTILNLDNFNQLNYVIANVLRISLKLHAHAKQMPRLSLGIATIPWATESRTVTGGVMFNAISA